MSYERTRDNRDDASNDVVVKKSTLTALGITIFVLLAIIFIMVYQNYEQNEELNNLTNNRNYTATHVGSQPASATQE